MQYLTAICIILFILIIFIYVLYRNKKIPDGILLDTCTSMANSANYQYDQYFTSPLKLYEKTIGHEFDDTAKLALQKAQKKEDMYYYNETANRMSRNKIADATVNSFVLANLLNYNANDRDKAENYYNTTLRRITENPAQMVNTNVDFIIDRTQDFYDDYALQTLDPIIVNQIYRNINTARNNVRNAKVANTANSGDHYYQTQPLLNDPQNVHDSYVNENMRKIYTNIITQNTLESPIATSIAEIKEAVKKYPFSNKKMKTHALQIVDRMAAGNAISSLQTNERDLLLNIWNRIHSADNSESRDSLKLAFMNALADGMEKSSNGDYHEICTSGRCSKMLGALTILDAHPEISRPMQTKQMLRNEIFAKTYQIIQNQLAQAPRDIAESYNGTSNSVDLTDFYISLKNDIDAAIRADYMNLVKKEDLDEIIKDAQAGVEI
jgi:hypothetical protein